MSGNPEISSLYEEGDFEAALKAFRKALEEEEEDEDLEESLLVGQVSKVEEEKANQVLESDVELVETELPDQGEDKNFLEPSFVGEGGCKDGEAGGVYSQLWETRNINDDKIEAEENIGILLAEDVETAAVLDGLIQTAKETDVQIMAGTVISSSPQTECRLDERDVELLREAPVHFENEKGMVSLALDRDMDVEMASSPSIDEELQGCGTFISCEESSLQAPEISAIFRPKDQERLGDAQSFSAPSGPGGEEVIERCDHASTCVAQRHFNDVSTGDGLQKDGCSFLKTVWLLETSVKFSEEEVTMSEQEVHKNVADRGAVDATITAPVDVEAEGLDCVLYEDVNIYSQDKIKEDAFNEHNLDHTVVVDHRAEQNAQCERTDAAVESGPGKGSSVTDAADMPCDETLILSSSAVTNLSEAMVETSESMDAAVNRGSLQQSVDTTVGSVNGFEENQSNPVFGRKAAATEDKISETMSDKVLVSNANEIIRDGVIPCEPITGDSPEQVQSRAFASLSEPLTKREIGLDSSPEPECKVSEIDEKGNFGAWDLKAGTREGGEEKDQLFEVLDTETLPRGSSVSTEDVFSMLYDKSIVGQISPEILCVFREDASKYARTEGDDNFPSKDMDSMCVSQVPEVPTALSSSSGLEITVPAGAVESFEASRLHDVTEIAVGGDVTVNVNKIDVASNDGKEGHDNTVAMAVRCFEVLPRSPLQVGSGIAHCDDDKLSPETTKFDEFQEADVTARACLQSGKSILADDEAIKNLDKDKEGACADVTLEEMGILHGHNSPLDEVESDSDNVRETELRDPVMGLEVVETSAITRPVQNEAGHNVSIGNQGKDWSHFLEQAGILDYSRGNEKKPSKEGGLCLREIAGHASGKSTSHKVSQVEESVPVKTIKRSFEHEAEVLDDAAKQAILRRFFGDIDEMTTDSMDGDDGENVASEDLVHEASIADTGEVIGGIGRKRGKNWAPSIFSKEIQGEQVVNYGTTVDVSDTSLSFTVGLRSEGFHCKPIRPAHTIESSPVAHAAGEQLTEGGIYETTLSRNVGLVHNTCGEQDLAQTGLKVTKKGQSSIASSGLVEKLWCLSRDTQSIASDPAAPTIRPPGNEWVRSTTEAIAGPVPTLGNTSVCSELKALRDAVKGHVSAGEVVSVIEKEQGSLASEETNLPYVPSVEINKRDQDITFSIEEKGFGTHVEHGQVEIGGYSANGITAHSPEAKSLIVDLLFSPTTDQVPDSRYGPDSRFACEADATGEAVFDKETVSSESVGRTTGIVGGVLVADFRCDIREALISSETPPEPVVCITQLPAVNTNLRVGMSKGAKNREQKRSVVQTNRARKKVLKEPHRVDAVNRVLEQQISCPRKRTGTLQVGGISYDADGQAEHHVALRSRATQRPIATLAMGENPKVRLKVLARKGGMQLDKPFTPLSTAPCVVSNAAVPQSDLFLYSPQSTTKRPHRQRRSGALASGLTPSTASHGVSQDTGRRTPDRQQSIQPENFNSLTPSSNVGQSVLLPPTGRGMGLMSQNQDFVPPVQHVTDASEFVKTYKRRPRHKGQVAAAAVASTPTPVAEPLVADGNEMGETVGRPKRRRQTPDTDEPSRKQLQQNFQRLRRIIIRKLEAWGSQSNLLLQDKGELENGKQHLGLNEEQREEFVQEMVKTCQVYPRMRALFLGAVRNLANSDVMAIAASKIQAEGQCDLAEDVLEASEHVKVKTDAKPSPFVQLYDAVDKLHKEGSRLFNAARPSQEPQPDLLLTCTDDRQWDLQIPLNVARASLKTRDGTAKDAIGAAPSEPVQTSFNIQPILQQPGYGEHLLESD